MKLLMCPTGWAPSRSYYQVMIKCPQLGPRGPTGHDSVSEDNGGIFHLRPPVRSDALSGRVVPGLRLFKAQIKTLEGAENLGPRIMSSDK